jgi:hypothetical protein
MSADAEDEDEDDVPIAAVLAEPLLLVFLCVLSLWATNDGYGTTEPESEPVIGMVLHSGEVLELQSLGSLAALTVTWIGVVRGRCI